MPVPLPRRARNAPHKPGIRSGWRRGIRVPASQVSKKSTRCQLCLTRWISLRVRGSTPTASSGILPSLNRALHSIPWRWTSKASRLVRHSDDAYRSRGRRLGDAFDFEVPGLSVVTAWRPARQIENLLADSHIDSTAPVDKTYTGPRSQGAVRQLTILN